MTIHNPPHYRYSLSEPWDKEAFEFIKQLGKNKKYPALTGTKNDKNRYLAILIRTQKSFDDWRGLLKDTLHQIKETGLIDTVSLIRKYPPESISKEVAAWAVYEEDVIVNNFIDELETRKITFTGSDIEMGEFVMRFILGQLGHDWEWTIMMIWEMLGEGEIFELKLLNEEMKKFDYMKLFK
ncbi:MAG: hypothetical protein NUV98_05470 [Candidatus Roizmanbacteria bacterium]|nr:hypothetical protein [Candidatus Roizmanbacteria bacterium]